MGNSSNTHAIKETVRAGQERDNNKIIPSGFSAVSLERKIFLGKILRHGEVEGKVVKNRHMFQLGDQDIFGNKSNMSEN